MDTVAFAEAKNDCAFAIGAAGDAGWLPIGTAIESGDTQPAWLVIV